MIALSNESEISMSTDIRTLMVHADFLRRIALGLLGDEGLADDAVQETWMTAMHKRPSGTAIASVRSWLASVTRNNARQIARSESRRASRQDATARREAVPSASEIAERERIRREVVAAVMELPETYRDVVLLRYFEDLQPREIAKRLEVPTETVRTRLRRATDLMRSRLDRTHESREAWRAALVPLALPAGAPSAVAASASGTVAFLAQLPLTIAASLLGIAALLAWLLWSQSPPEGMDPIEGISATAHVEDHADATGELERGAAVASSNAQPGDPAREGLLVPAIHGRITAPDRAPLVGHELRLIGRNVQTVEEAVRMTRGGWIEEELPLFDTTTRTDSQGRYRFEEIPSGSYLLVLLPADGHPLRTLALLYVGLDGPLPESLRGQIASVSSLLTPTQPALHEIATGKVLELDAQRIPGRTLTGRVVNADDTPVSGATVVAGPAIFVNNAESISNHQEIPLATTLTDDRGEYRIDGALGVTGVGVLAPGFVNGVQVVEVGAPDADENHYRAADIVLEAAARWTVRGLVLDEVGALAGATLRHLSVTPGVPAGGTVTSDHQGRFELHFGQTRETEATIRVEATGYRSLDVRLKSPDSPRCQDLMLTLEPVNELRLQLVDGSGQPLSNGWASIQPDRAAGHHDTIRARPDEEQLVFQSPPSRVLALQAGCAGHEIARCELDLTQGLPADPIEIELEPIAWQIVVRTLTPAGAPASETIRLAGMDDGIQYFSFHLYKEDPATLIEARGHSTVFPGDAWGDRTHHLTAVHEGERRLRLPRYWQGERGWLVLRLAGHTPIVQAFDRQTEELTFTVDPTAVARSIAVVGARPKRSLFQPHRNSITAIHDPDGIRLGASTGYVSLPEDAYVVERPGSYDARITTETHFGQASIDVELGSASIVEIPMTRGLSLAGQAIWSADSTSSPGSEASEPHVSIEDAQRSVIIYSGSFPHIQLIGDDGRMHSHTATADGSFEFGGLAPGPYDLRIRIPDHGMVTVPVQLEAGKNIRDLDVEVPAMSMLDICLDRSELGGEYWTKGSWQLRRSGQSALLHTGDRVVASPNTIYAGPLEPGVYELTITSGPTGRRSYEFAIEASTTGRVTLPQVR